jgi:hypothetical protein
MIYDGFFHRPYLRLSEAFTHKAITNYVSFFVLKPKDRYHVCIVFHTKSLKG